MATPGVGEREEALQTICRKMTETRSMGLSTKELSLTAVTRDVIPSLQRSCMRVANSAFVGIKVHRSREVARIENCAWMSSGFAARMSSASSRRCFRMESDRSGRWKPMKTAEQGHLKVKISK
jgi:hypothetical protein